jgi:hypothetical protein
VAIRENQPQHARRADRPSGGRGIRVGAAGGDRGAVDESLSELRTALTEAFIQPIFTAHFSKLARTKADEHHLYVPVRWSALPFPVSYGLMFGTQLPPETWRRNTRSFRSGSTEFASTRPDH